MKYTNMNHNYLTKNDFHKICRTCLNSSENMTSVFDTEVLNMLSQCTSLTISCDDGLPHQICSTCFTKTVDSFSYRQQCEHSDQFLRQLLIKNEGKFTSTDHDEFKSEIIDENTINVKLETNDIKNDDTDLNNQGLVDLEDTSLSSADDDKDDDEILTHTNDFLLNTSNKVVDSLNRDRDTARAKALNMWGLDKCDPDTSTCKICNKVLVNTNSLVRHMEIHNENRKFNVVCKICNKGFYETGHLTKHMLRHKGEARYKCEKCPKMFYELSALGIHLKRRHKVKPSVCGECGKSFLVKLQLENHMRAAHGEQKKFVCSECGKAYHQESLLRKHQTAHTNQRLFHCLQCDKSYKDKPNLAKHIKRAHLSETKREVCTICGKSIINLQKHLAYVHGDEHVKCTECSKEFTSTFCLNDHIKKKHRKSDAPRKKPYLCSDCGYTCEGKSSLKTHYEQKHTQVRAYKCTICTKCFKTRGELTKHIRYTHNYDPHTANTHACDQCTKTFKTKSALQYHVRYTHSDEKQFICTGCTKQFKTKGTLKIHMRTHTGERPFECKYCGKTFGQGSTLKTHMKVHGGGAGNGTGSTNSTNDVGNIICNTSNETNNTTTMQVIMEAQQTQAAASIQVESLVTTSVVAAGTTTIVTPIEKHSNTTDNDDEHVEKFQTCTGLQISVDDALPHLICDECQNQIIKSYDFKASCLNNDEILQQILIEQSEENDSSSDEKPTSIFDENNDESEIKSDDDQQLEVEDNSSPPSDHEEPTVKCEICGKLTKKRTYDSHLRRHEKPIKYKCDLCDKAYRQPCELATHKERTHGTVCTIKCTVCNRVFQLQAQLDFHLRRHFKKKYTCDICSKDFIKSTMLARHKEIHGSQRTKYCCTQCDASFLQEVSLKRHVANRHTDTPIQKKICNICGLAVVNLRPHLLLKHTTGPQFKCEQCDRAFLYRSQWMNHIKEKHEGVPKQKNALCITCGKGFPSQGYLRKHFSTHSDARNFKCHLCPKRYKKSDHLKVHLRVHAGLRPHVCTVCSKAFHTSTILKNHIRTHTGEKPFACHVCNRAFAHKAVLITHMKNIHNGSA
ncbi:zinc finger protein 729-like [Chrysoperla carnea]|uniref:zinc finger protein 729-like n=1 Tax=Chrysoperla carnea TaxID=189513 RepID=UPI001D06ECA0|nr:zinc finger protein 729-like [Chrysoperla carnea]